MRTLAADREGGTKEDEGAVTRWERFRVKKPRRSGGAASGSGEGVGPGLAGVLSVAYPGGGGWWQSRELGVAVVVPERRRVGSVQREV
jgi:hypothetical protein